MIKHLLLLTFVLFLAGCTSFSDEKPTPPAKPIAQKKQPAKAANKKPVANNNHAAQKQGSVGPTTYALEDSKPSFAVEATQAPIKAEPIAPAPAANASANSSGNVPVIEPEAVNTPVANPTAGNLTMAAYTPEEVRVGSETPPAVVALIGQADGYRKKGDLDSSVTSLERALRIDARNAALTYKLAQLRLTQRKPQMAEELAGKAALLAGGDLDIKRKSWLLIAEARRQQQDLKGAKEAKAKAESFFGR